MYSVKRMTFLFLALGLTASLSAQSWKKMAKTADDLFQKGEYAQAADAYEKAWQKKNKKELMFKAGESYYLLRNYRKAVETYQNVKDDNGEFPLVGLKYARSLKQDGQYDKAVKAFQDFQKSYTGEGKAVLADIVETEIEGCELAKSLSLQPQPEVETLHPGAGINTSDNEFAPIAMAQDVLYFSSTMGGQARIYRSEFSNNAWSKGVTPANFPVVQNGQYCHGSLSPDETRFYFTICENKGKFGNLTTRCEIFLIRREGAGWSAPERLPETINTKGVTSTQPWVAHRGDVEILYFASNRSGGRGGMDLWYVTRNLNSDSGFSQPVNLGATINSLGDEMTPYYDQTEGMLYFASNGLPSLGGFDLFKARGDLTNWSVPENAGLPFNSSADDAYLVKSTDGRSVFLSSNRIFAGEKLNSLDDDLFEIRFKPNTIALEGAVFDQEQGEALRSYSLTLFEIQDNGAETALLTRLITSGNYSFEVLPQRQYRVEVNAEGYENASYSFFTDNPAASAYGQPLFLKRMGATPPVVNPPVVYPPVVNPPVNPPGPSPIGADGETYTARGTSPSDNLEYQSTAPRFQGVYYKIQLAASGKFDPADPRFAKFSALGTLQTEYILQRNLTRVLIGDFMTDASAKSALAEVKKKGFPSAFVAKYENGVRYGRVNL